MTDLERIELALYRVHANRAEEFRAGTRGCLNNDTQALLLELIAELQDLSRPKPATV